MSPYELLSVEPRELQFPFELEKKISCSLKLSNETGNYVAFKVKTTNRKNYCVKPSNGVVLPWSTCNVLVTMQAQKKMPPDMQCKDKFLIQSVVVSPGTIKKGITPEMFNKEAGHHVEECKSRVAYVKPPQPPSLVLEASQGKSSSPRWTSFFDSWYLNARALISKLNVEKSFAIQENEEGELELLRRGNKNKSWWDLLKKNVNGFTLCR